MPLPAFQGLDSLPALDHLDLVAAPVASALTGWARTDEVAVVGIDPDLADTAALTDAYSLPLEASVNCVLVAGSRGGEERIAACLVAADTRADVNTVVRKLLDVRKASFLPMDRAVAESGMEYGGITPIGLPAAWRVLVDAAVLDGAGGDDRLGRPPLQDHPARLGAGRPAGRRGRRGAGAAYGLTLPSGSSNHRRASKSSVRWSWCEQSGGSAASRMRRASTRYAASSVTSAVSSWWG